ncbi:MAG: hypothetical protein V1647_05855 [Pseudomonadota bacterium]
MKRNKKYFEQISIELENIEKSLLELPHYKKLSKLSLLELAGTAAMLHSIYNGVENILKQLCAASIPEGRFWHKELLLLSVKKKIIKKRTAELLKEYLAFRHFFVHAYSLDIYSEKMSPLVQHVPKTIKMFKADIKRFTRG